jgi:hypothetical protein
MADATYVKAIEALWQAGVDLLGDTINVVFCDSTYTPDTTSSGDEFLSDIPSGARLATATLSGRTLSGGVFDATDVVMASTPAGGIATQAIIYKDASPESGARLIRKITSADNFPITFDGGQFTFLWPNDANKIFRTHDG